MLRNLQSKTVSARGFRKVCMEACKILLMTKLKWTGRVRISINLFLSIKEMRFQVFLLVCLNLRFVKISLSYILVLLDVI